MSKSVAGFVECECDADRVIACCTQVAPGTLGAFDQIAARGLAEFNPDSVEEIFVRYLEAKLAQTFREFSGEIVDALRNSAQSLLVRDKPAYIAAITANKTWAVQMLLVALSRRMCCSRVCSANR